MGSSANAAVETSQAVDTAKQSVSFRLARGSDLSGLPDPVAELARAFEDGRELDAVLAEARISEDKAHAVVKKLTSLGHLERVRRPAKKPATPEFSRLENAFFSSRVAPIDACDLPFEGLGDKLRRLVGRKRTVEEIRDQRGSWRSQRTIG